jgi:hypothetical protein
VWSEVVEQWSGLVNIAAFLLASSLTLLPHSLNFLAFFTHSLTHAHIYVALLVYICYSYYIIFCLFVCLFVFDSFRKSPVTSFVMKTIQ